VDTDARYYQRLGGSGLLALRAKMFKSWGDAPDFMYFGGNSEMRGYDYLEFLGEEAAFLNAELRFPFIEAMLTPIGILGGIRGVFFANMGGGRFGGQPFKWWSTSPQVFTPIVDITRIAGQPVEVPGAPRQISGFRLVDARASYGVGLETFALGFPVHFDWAWRTLFNKDWEDALFALPCGDNGFFEIERNCGGSSAFRKPRFAVWIGYDF
jgi:outer membrane protein assembly factor BamA